MLYKLCILSLLVSSFIFAQQADRVIASVGKYKITESEFNERFDFGIHPGLLQKSNRDSIKLDFLNQLIAEKLLSQEAQSKGLDTFSIFRNILTPLRNMYMRDMLYQLEIKNKVTVTPEEISTGLKRIKSLLKLKFIFSRDHSELQAIYEQLLSGASFDSLLSLRKEMNERREITYGTMEKNIEDSVYKLKPGEFTKLLESRDGYYILKLIEIQENLQKKSDQELAEDVRKIAAARNEFKHYLEYYRNFFSPYKISADRQIFEVLILKFLTKFRVKYDFPDTTENIILSGEEVTSVSEELGNELNNKTFIDINGKFIRLPYFLNQLSHEGFMISEIREMKVRTSLSSYIRKFIEDELLTEEARKQGLNEHKDVKRYMQMWGDSYLSKMLMIDILDSLKKSKINLTGNENCYSEQVNIVEILNDNLSIMEKVINEMAKGKNIRELAKEYTIRDSVRTRGGELGLLPISKLGEMGKIASRINIGEIYGPVQLKEGYAIFQLIDRKIDSSSVDNPTSEMKEEFIMNSTLENFEQYLNSYNAKLARKYGVRIYEDVLKNTDNNFLNLIVVRYMGFGGQIFAVPYTEQYSGWYDLWKQSTGEPGP